MSSSIIVLIYIRSKVQSLQLPYILSLCWSKFSVSCHWKYLCWFCYLMTVRRRTRQSTSRQSEAGASADHPCRLHLPENLPDCVCRSLIDTLTLVTGVMCFPPQKTPPEECEVQYGVMNRLELYLCVYVCVSVWWSLQCVNFRRCLRRRTAVLKDMTHYWLYRPLSVHPSLPGDLRNKEQIYLPARFAESFPPVCSGTFFSPRHGEAEMCRVLNQPA